MRLIGALIPAFWLAWGIYWAVTSGDVKETERQESERSRLLHMLPLALAGFLLGVRHTGVPLLDAPLPGLSHRPAVLTGVPLTAVGLAFAVWARRHLGRNWSAAVTLKTGHELVTHGPYALVRHPIYTGILLAFFGSALARGDVRGVICVAIVWVSLWRKLRLEERWMRERFGPDYAAYAKRVKALLPFVF